MERRIPKTSDPERDAAVAASLDELRLALDKAMWEEGVSRAELGRGLGVDPTYVTQMLNGATNLSLRTVAEAAHLLGRRLHIEMNREA